MNKTFNILIIDDDLNYVEIFKKWLRGKDAVITVFSKESDLDLKIMHSFDMIFVDFNLDGWTLGNELITKISKFTNADFCLMSTSDAHETKANVINAKINAIGKKHDQGFINDWFEDTKAKRFNLYDYE